MSTIHPVPPEFAAKALTRKDDYERLYAESVKDPEGFWARVRSEEHTSELQSHA